MQRFVRKLTGSGSDPVNLSSRQQQKTTYAMENKIKPRTTFFFIAGSKSC